MSLNLPKTGEQPQIKKRHAELSNCKQNPIQSSIKEQSTRIHRIVLSRTVWDYCDLMKLGLELYFMGLVSSLPWYLGKDYVLR